jgi:glycosyltransferase involved in cell wall biosynthesis
MAKNKLLPVTARRLFDYLVTITMNNNELDFCVLIPCYNNPQGLMTSLRSIFYDTDRFAIIIIDDGSAVPVSAGQIQSEIKTIGSITVIRNEHNKGIADSLNLGLKWIGENFVTKYIARLDCGDTCHPYRFYRQVEYLNAHSNVGLLGTWCIFENRRSGARYQYRTPTDHEKIKTEMHWRNVFIHPTVMFRADLIKQSGYYPTDFLHAEDYAFFWKLIKMTRSHILDDFLVTCEINKEGLSFKNRNEQLLMQIKIIDRLGTSPIMKIAGILRVKTLSLLPKRLVLPLKHWIKKQ